MLAEVVREGAVVCLTDVRVCGGLVLPAAREEDMGGRVRHPFEKPVNRKVFLLAAEDVDRRRQVPLLHAHGGRSIFPGEVFGHAFGHAHLSCGGSRMAAIEEDLEADAFGDL